MAIREATPIVLTAEERIRLKGWVHLEWMHSCVAASGYRTARCRWSQKMRLAGVPFDSRHSPRDNRTVGNRARRRARALHRVDWGAAAGCAQGRAVGRGALAAEGARLDAAHQERRTVGARGSPEAPGASRRDPAALTRTVGREGGCRKFGYVLLEAVDPITGRIYPDYLTCGAKTGRLTSSRPNGQQLPQDGRSAVTAPPERRLVCGDLDQVELRVLAELAGDDAMRAVFAAGGDVHKRTASLVAGVPEAMIDKNDPRRQAAKAINFGIAFAAGASTVRASAWAKFDVDLSLKEAADARAAVLRAYPAIAAYQRRQEQIGLHARVIHSIAGRPLRADWEKTAY